jgi:hypothetical protein
MQKKTWEVAKPPRLEFMQTQVVGREAGLGHWAYLCTDLDNCVEVKVAFLCCLSDWLPKQ